MNANLPSRRRFMRMLTASGLCAGLPLSLRARPARAATPARPLLFCVEATGAYDITLICDPRGNGGQANPPNHGYAPADIVSYGEMRVAPQVPAVASFFAAYHAQTLVVNGVDTSTIDHATGRRSSMSGMGATGYPVTAAVVAATLGASLPAPYMSNGGYNYAANQVGLTLLNSGISDALLTAMDGGGVHTAANWSAVQSAIEARLARRAASVRSTLPRKQLQLMQTAFAGAGALSQLTDTIADLNAGVSLSNPSNPALVTDANTALNIQVVMAGYKAGQTVSAEMEVGAFDTHTTNDPSQTTSLANLFGLVDYVLRCASHLGLSDQLLVYIGSDFGRTPYYNSADLGKDHWPTTSVMMVNPGRAPNMPVGTVLGATDAGLNPVPVDPSTLRPAQTGTTIKPGHLHDALRRWYGVDQGQVAASFPLHMPEQMPLMG